MHATFIRSANRQGALKTVTIIKTKQWGDKTRERFDTERSYVYVPFPLEKPRLVKSTSG